MGVIERSLIIERTTTGQEGSMVGAASWAFADYSFAADGGAISSINLLPSSLPLGSIILGGYVEVTTVPVGAGASIGISSEGAADLVAVAAISGAPWSTVGRKSIIPAFTGAASIKLTAARNIAAVISGAVLTAGAFRVAVYYLQP